MPCVARIEQGPVGPLDYHFLGPDTPPSELFMIDPFARGHWARLPKEDALMQPYKNAVFYYVRASDAPDGMTEDGEPYWVFLRSQEQWW